MRILGIDCGSRVTGYGVIEAHGRALRPVGYGAIRTPHSGELADRLVAVAEGLDDVIRRYRPDEAAIEDAFTRVNARSALVLAHVRGVAVLSAARAGLSVASYAPAQVKSSVAGLGNASKEQVRFMVGSLLGLREVISPLDISDALAVACSHANLRDAAARGG